MICNRYNCILILILLFFLFLGGCKNKREERVAAQAAPVSVQTQTVQTSDIANQVEIVATVQATQNAEISSRVSGNIISIEVVPGSLVTKGQQLIKLSAEEIYAQLQQAEAQRNQAARNLKREQKLLAQKAATHEAVKSLEDALRIAEAGFREAKTILSYTVITAPFDGVITRKLVDTGDLATPGKPLLYLANEKNLQVLADVPETLTPNLNLDMQVDIEVPAAQLHLKGNIIEIAPASDPRSRTVPIKIDIAEPPSLRSGQFARVSIPGSITKTILIPSAAITPIGQMERVFLAADGKARLRLVRTGRQYGKNTEILSGLAVGDEVIIDQGQNLQDNQAIVTR